MASTILWRESFDTFERLLALTQHARAPELERLKGSRPDLYAHVVKLLEADAQPGVSDFLDGGADAGAIRRDKPVEHAPGATVGAYELERPLGAGGMGEVWYARRADGLFEAPVALKLMHAHLAGSSVRSRFVREGKILGQLTHPNIAHLLDAGITPAGQLYLAIEYVDGVALDHWCDDKRLGVNERVRLFLQVCDAVTHAHAHLIVHRDLKPGNILVTPEGNIKLLDFGIAKLTESTDSESPQTELTRLGGRVLTPEYAAPEQITNQPVTVTTDVYSLGVLLYVLLSGRRPYGKPGQSLAQLEREVLETDPAPVSNTLSGSASREAAEFRGTTVRRIKEMLKGDLDVIVARALKKKPDERYASVPALADDLRRYLDHQPVLAQPDSLGYRAGKYFRRNRVAVSAGAAISLAIVAGIAGTLWQAQRAQQEARRAEAQATRAEQQAKEARDQAQRVKRTKDFFVSIFQEADPLKRSDAGPVTVAAALDDAIKRVDSELDKDPSLQADLLDDFGEIEAGRNDVAAAKAMFERALPLHEQTRAPDDPAIANTLVNLGVIQAMLGKSLEGRPFMERAVAILEKHADTEADALNNARMGLANVYAQQGDYAKTAELFRRSLDYYRQSPDPKQRRLSVALGNLAIITFNSGDVSQAKTYYQECIAIIERNVGKDSGEMSDCLYGMTMVADREGDLPTQVAYAERAVHNVIKNFPGDHLWTARALIALGDARSKQRRTEEAETAYRQAIAMLDRIGGAPTTHILARLGLAMSREAAHAPAEALAIAEPALTLCAQLPEPVRGRNCALLETTRKQALADLGRAQ